MVDQGEIDDKIISVAKNDISYEHIDTIDVHYYTYGLVTTPTCDLGNLEIL